MISNEVLKKVSKIEIITRRLVNDVFAGEYHSIFKGHGMEFLEVREYSIGDDIRSIDWNVSARSGNLFVKKYQEERELTVILLIDVSSSSRFGSVNQLKSDLAAEISAVLAFSAIRNNDKVGVIIFSDIIEKYIPPKKGKSHILRIIREIITFKPKNKKTDINVALNYLNRVIKRKSIVFILSDFISPDYSKSISITNKKHDVTALYLSDPREKEIKNSGFILLEDSESGEELWIDTTDRNLIKNFEILNNREYKLRKKLFTSINLGYIDIYTDKSYILPLVNFFKERIKRYH